MNTKNIKAVIFDMDGVLFDTERMSCECCFEAAKQLGLTLAEEAVYGGHLGSHMHHSI